MTVDGYLVDVGEACQTLGIETYELYRLIDEGLMPAYLIDDELRIRSSDLAQSPG